MVSYAATCLAFTLLVALGVTAAYKEDSFERAVRTLEEFSRLRHVAAERRRGFKEDYCKPDGQACLPPAKFCCGESVCYWPDGFSLIREGVCVYCVKEQQTCFKDDQCCDGLHCEKAQSTYTDGKCVRSGAGVDANGEADCPGEGQKCRRDSQCCQTADVYLQCDKARPVYLDGTCARVRRAGSCYRDGQCVNDCKKDSFPYIYGTCQ